MKVLFCNKYNYRFSGTEVHLFELMDLLRSQGHEVALFSMSDPRGGDTPYDQHFVPHIDFKGKASVGRKVLQAGHAIYSWQARRRLRAMIREFRPDVAHVRNIYHHLSPSILWELKKQNVPVVYHLNDFKLLCPSYNMVSQGESCEDCKGGAFWHALRPQCYTGLGARATLATEAYVHRWMGTYRKCVDVFLAPSEFVRTKFTEHGWDSRKFEVLPHFQEVHTTTDFPADVPALYFGRLSAEKGVADLLHAMAINREMRLIVAGDGPDRGRLERLAASLELTNVEFVGHQSAGERDQLISRSMFTVLPSHAYETLGKTILESYAEGRAVIATDTGSRRELVDHGKTGLLYATGDVEQLAASMRFLQASPQVAAKMGQAGRSYVRERHSPEAYLRNLLSLYERMISVARRKRELVFTTGAPPWKFRRTTREGLPNASAERRKLRVAFIGGRGVISKYSGIETYYEEVGTKLAEMGHEVTLYCRTHFTPPVEEYRGMRLLRLPTVKSKHFETLFHTLLSTAHAMTRRYDVVHYHALGPALFSFLPRISGSKTAVTVQGLDWQRKKWGRFAAAVLRFGEWASARFPNETMVVSKVLQQRFRSLYGQETSYVPNGGVLRDRTDPTKIMEWGLEPGKYVLFLGRFSPEKGCHLLVEAFEQLPGDVKLVMAGAASYCDAYSRELRQHASDRIRIMDWVSGEALDALLTNAMIFVLPSDLEGLSLALLDAMGAGLCVLTSDVPENREVVDGAGFTFKSGNASDLADRLQFLIANPAVREAAGREARRRIEAEYQWQKVSRDVEKSYCELLGIPQQAPSEKRPMGYVAGVAEDEIVRRAG